MYPLKSHYLATRPVLSIVPSPLMLKMWKTDRLISQPGEDKLALIKRQLGEMGRPHLLAWDSGVSRQHGEAAHLIVN